MGDHTAPGRIPDHNKKLPIIELYTAVQSEGSRAGYPTIIIRTTGCTHRCYFGSGGWCDTWYTSIHAEKGKYCFNDVVKLYAAHPHIREMMITGGAPTMHPSLVNELMHLANRMGLFVTMETEGSHFIKTDHPIDLVSISPKFSGSVPILGIKTPKGKTVDDAMIKQHNRFRLNLEAIRQTIDYHHSYHLLSLLPTPTYSCHCFFTMAHTTQL